MTRQKNPKIRNMWLALIHKEQKERNPSQQQSSVSGVSRLLTLDDTEVFCLPSWPQNIPNLPLAPTHLVLPSQRASQS